MYLCKYYCPQYSPVVVRTKTARGQHMLMGLFIFVMQMIYYEHRMVNRYIYKAMD